MSIPRTEKEIEALRLKLEKVADESEKTTIKSNLASKVKESEKARKEYDDILKEEKVLLLPSPESSLTT